MDNIQAGILADIPVQARYLTFSILPGSAPEAALERLTELVDGESVVLGLGKPLLEALDADIAGLVDFPAYNEPGAEVPSTPQALWIWLRDDDRGELVHAARKLRDALQDTFHLEQVIDAFRYGSGLDLTGYEDGTENPVGEDAVAAGVVTGARPGLDGSSFVAVQQWVHDLGHFMSQPQAARDNIIGRRQSDNEELGGAPESAHVKRTAQEDFEPEAFVVRRSMPWADEHSEGLVFVAFGHSVAAFDALLHRMVGRDDGVVDALFGFTRPVTGSYFWCPPLRDGRLDLSALDS
ncbi:MAG: Dyp-type peroxidase [Gammaproteobacteria bacterium]|nr:MAG: Dyp-type peroxidase [Gammaproteobacteria bacterium]